MQKEMVIVDSDLFDGGIKYLGFASSHRSPSNGMITLVICNIAWEFTCICVCINRNDRISDWCVYLARDSRRFSALS